MPKFKDKGCDNPEYIKTNIEDNAEKHVLNRLKSSKNACEFRKMIWEPKRLQEISLFPLKI